MKGTFPIKGGLIMEKIESVNIYRYGNSEDIKECFKKKAMLEKTGYELIQRKWSVNFVCLTYKKNN